MSTINVSNNVVCDQCVIDVNNRPKTPKLLNYILQVIGSDLNLYCECYNNSKSHSELSGYFFPSFIENTYSICDFQQLTEFNNSGKRKENNNDNNREEMINNVENLEFVSQIDIIDIMRNPSSHFLKHRLINYPELFKDIILLPIKPIKNVSDNSNDLIVIYSISILTRIENIRAYLTNVEKFLPNLQIFFTFRSNYVLENEIADKNDQDIVLVPIDIKQSKYELISDNNINDNKNDKNDDWVLKMKAFLKMKGGKCNMPKRLNTYEVMVAFIGPFLSIAILQSIFDGLNRNVTINNQSNLFKVLGSFGAMTTM